MNHDFTLTPVDVAEGRAVMVTCPDCGQLEVWSEQESNDHGLCRSRGGACWCDPVVGEWVSYTKAGGQRTRGQIAVITPESVLFEGGDWCYRWEISM